MSGHVMELIPEFALGELTLGQAAEVEQHLVDCAACQAELCAVSDALSAVAMALDPVDPTWPLVRARARLMEEIGRGGRFSRFVAKVARHLDIAADKAVEMLERLDRGDGWEPLPLPGVMGIEYFTPPTGPRLAGATVAVLRLQPRARFPRHGHGGAEEVLVIEGGFHDEQSGRDFHPGHVQAMAVGTSHSFVGLDGDPCICIGVVLGAIDLLEG